MTFRSAYWTPERMSDLRRLADGSRSAAVIASALGGISRNAVISKVYKTEGLRLSANTGCVDPAWIARNRAVNPSRPQALPQRRMKRVLPNPQANPAPSPFNPRMIPFSKLKDGLCKYPYGESPPYHFCGCKSVKGLSWCVEHLRIVSASAKAFEGHPQAAGVRKSASR